MFKFLSLFDDKKNLIFIIPIVFIVLVFVIILTQTEMMVEIKLASDLTELKIDTRPSL